MSKVSLKKTTDKPRKPYPDYPLFPHATKRWAKKIRGKLHYFGPWADPDAAIAKYQREREDLYAGRTPRQPAEGLTVRELVNLFLTAKRHLLDAGELTPLGIQVELVCFNSISNMTTGVLARMLWGNWAGMWIHVPAVAATVSSPRPTSASPRRKCMIAGVEAVCSESSWPWLNPNNTTLSWSSWCSVRLSVPSCGGSMAVKTFGR